MLAQTGEAENGAGFLAGGGEAARLIASIDWSASPLGPMNGWPQSLRTALGLVLRSPTPIVLLWGEGGVMLYNDAYSIFAGARHPKLLGAPVRDGWPEVADFNDHVMRVGLAGGTLSFRDQELTLFRHERPEQVFMDLDYSPVPGEDGKPAGVMAVVAETTAKVLAQRRLRFLVELADALSAAETPADVTAQAAAALGRHLGVGRAGFGDVDEEAGTVSVARDWTDGTMASLAGEARILDAFGPEVIAELRGGQTLVVEDCRTDPRTADPRFLPTWDSIGARALVVAPLMRRGLLSAILYAHAAAPRRWREDEVALVGDVARRTGAAHAQAQAEQALRDSEELFRLATQAVDAMVYDWDVRTGHVSRSEGLARLLGFRPEEVEPTSAWWRSRIHPDDVAARGRPAQAAIDAGRRRFEVEYRVRHKDGRWVDVVDTGIVVVGPDGRPARAVGTSVDVTARRQAEAALRESEARLRLALYAGRLGEVVFDLTTGGVLHSPAFAELYGHKPDKRLTLEELRAQYHPDDRDRVLAERAEVLDSGRDFYEVEKRVVWPDGQVRWVYGRGWVRRDPAGRPVSVVALYLDLTARKQAEQALLASQAALQELNATLEERVRERTSALAESERRFRAIFDTTFQLTGLAALDGTILVVNQAALAAVGAAQDDVAGLKMWESPWWAGTPEEADRLRAGVAEVARGAFVRYEAELNLPGGTRVFDFSMKPVLGEAGEPILLVAEGRDITDLKRAEDALRQAQKMEAVGQLTGGIAHDFNNLLGAVVGSFDLIRRRPDEPDRVRRFAEAGLAAAERGARLTGQLLAFSRAQRLELKSVVVSDLVEGMRDLVQRTLGPMIRLSLVAEDGRAVVVSDPVQLEMAVLNLAINARDAMPEGGALTIASRLKAMRRDPELEAGDYVELSVADTGQGMTPEVLARAFDPFFTTKGVGKGTGLGLSQAYAVAKQAGGAARIESRPGGGATVRLYLRVRPGQAETGPGQAAEPSPEPAAACAAVLVVDDDADMRRVMASALDALGYRVDEAADGPEGLARLGESRPDLLILDFAMPGMNGAEAARAARLSRPDLPILFVSGYADTAAIEEAAGPDAPILRKPFRVDELRAAIEAVFAAAKRG